MPATNLQYELRQRGFMTRGGRNTLLNWLEEFERDQPRIMDENE